MIVQYCIDWDGIRRLEQGAEKTRAQLVALHGAIRQNGLLVESGFCRGSLCAWKCEAEACGDFALGAVLGLFLNLRSEGAAVDVGATAEEDASMEGVIRAWGRFLKACGLHLNPAMAVQTRPARLLIGDGVGPSEAGRLFYEAVRPAAVLGDEEVVGLGRRWRQMQTFSNLKESRASFEGFLWSFAAASERIRIYDPYLATLFLSVEGDREYELRNRKAWRISLFYLLKFFAGNRNVGRIDLVTTARAAKIAEAGCQARDRRLTEIVADVLEPAARGRGAGLEICIHFLRPTNPTHSFHDRFIANQSHCFAIGHGCDVCCADREYKLRAIPPREGCVLSEFNVFYGCAKWSCPDELTVFNEGAAMYPGNGGFVTVGFDTKRLGDHFEISGKDRGVHPIVRTLMNAGQMHELRVSIASSSAGAGTHGGVR